ncbi:MAG TPA: hypothetical protein VG273_09165 [Bryobacteraceae bacterium]|nr:hypothetical protein [Bryobacteraceae bacterium]
MKSIYFALAVSGVVLGTLAPTARADQWDKQTELTFNEPVEIPGRVLPAGTYEFKLLESPVSDRHLVRIYNQDMTHLVTVVLAITDNRLQATGKTVVQFAERPAGSPQAIKAWFYPGAQAGLEFVYPHDRAAALAKENREQVYSTSSDLSSWQTKDMKAGDADSTNMKRSPVKSVGPDGTENELNSNSR